MLKTFSVTDIGKKRKLNQDYVFSSDRKLGNLSNVFIVADGMGGHNAGDYASRFTVDTMVEEIEKSFVRPNEISIDKVSRFNELVRKHFPPDNLDRI